MYVNIERQQVIIFSTSNARSKLHETWYFVRVSKRKLIVLYLFTDIQTHLYFVYIHLWRDWLCFFFSKENLGKPRRNGRESPAVCNITMSVRWEIFIPFFETKIYSLFFQEDLLFNQCKNNTNTFMSATWSFVMTLYILY